MKISSLLRCRGRGAAGRACRILADADRMKAGAQRIVEQQGAVEAVAEPQELLQYLDRLQGAERPLRQQPDPGSAVVARATPGVVARLLECRGPWCRVETDNAAGWMRRSDLWGVYPDETVP